jgi:competence protein ComEA
MTAGWAFRRAGSSPDPYSNPTGNSLIIESGEGFERPGLYPYPGTPEVSRVVRDAGGPAFAGIIPEDTGRIRLERDCALRLIPDATGKAAVEEAPLSNRALWILGRPLPLNRVSEPDLDRLPGIGPAMARRIIEYRESCGGFSSLEELQRVNGIKEKTFEKIKTYFVLP